MIDFFPSRTVALELFGWSVHWYGLLYMAGFLVALLILPRLQRWRGLHLTFDAWSSVLAWGVVGVIVGGRLGFVLFYEPLYYLGDPLEIVRVWHGGMSFHGGLLGVMLGIWIAARRRGIPLLALADCLVVPTAIGLALGRIGNFINQELYGVMTTVPWAITIPGVEGLRHPLQWYAVGKDFLIAFLCFWHLRLVRPVVAGRTTALFLILYAVLRYLLEYLRAQAYPLTDLGFMMMSRGQILTLPVLVFGIVLWVWVGRREEG